MSTELPAAIQLCANAVAAFASTAVTSDLPGVVVQRERIEVAFLGGYRAQHLRGYAWRARGCETVELSCGKWSGVYRRDQK